MTLAFFISYCMYANEMNENKNQFFFVFVAYLTVIAEPAIAHASEQGLVLLLPTGAYATAGTLVVIASILLVTCVPKSVLSKLFCDLSLGWRASSFDFSFVTSTIATAVLVLLIYIGFRGPTDPQSNLLPLTIWTVWWIGIFVVQGTTVDLWRWINPWTGLTHLLDTGMVPIVKIPDKWAAWPAVVVFLLFQIFMLADIAPNDPPRLAFLVLSYWVFTLIGISVCGKGSWLRQVECFTVMFSLISTLRPFQKGERLRVGLPGWMALKQLPLDPSRAVFSLVILAAGSFDGLHETFWWLAKIGINPLAFPGRSAVIWSTSLGLIAAILLLLLIYSASIWVGLKAIQGHKQSENITFSHAFCVFSVTLLPIALGYHFAHYLVTFMVQIKYVLSTASDPLALGWNLFGLGAVKVTTGFLNVPDTVKTIWLTQAFVVVFSHVLSVLMSHSIAAHLCSNNKNIAFIQIGLATLMIAYTVFGLWLLASPRGV
jgi:hypothetical protein